MSSLILYCIIRTYSRLSQERRRTMKSQRNNKKRWRRSKLLKKRSRGCEKKKRHAKSLKHSMSIHIALLSHTIISTRMKVSFISNTTTTKRNLFKILKASQAKPPSTSNLKKHNLSTMTERISLFISTLAWALAVETADKLLNTNSQMLLLLKTTMKRWSTSTTATSKSLLIIWASNTAVSNSQKVSSWYQTTRILSTQRKEKRNLSQCWSLTSNRKTWYADSSTSAHLTW